jgi:hypothetical protein
VSVQEVLEGPAGARADPVFVDRSGRRRRLFTGLGAGFGVVLVVGCVLLVAGLMGSSPVPLPGLPQSGQGALHGKDGGVGVQPAAPTPPGTPASHVGQPARSSTATSTAGARSATTQPAPTSSTVAPGNRHATHTGNPKPSRSK